MPLLCAFDDCLTSREKNMAVSPRGSERSAKKTTKEIREWAIGEGLEVSSRGRISAEIEQAFHDAQAQKSQVKPAPVKKTAAKKIVAETAAAKKRPAKKVIEEKAPAKRAAASKAPAKKTTREIRGWAIGEGLEVSSRGRIPAEIEQAFDDAQTQKIQATVPVKKTAAKKVAAKKTAAKKTAAAAPVKRTAASKAPADKRTVATKAAVKKVAVKKPVKRAVVRKAPAKTTNKEIRDWASADGREVSSRGRIPAEVEQAFHDAQAKKVRTRTAPVRKTAAKKIAAKKTAAAAAPVKRVAASKAPADKEVVATKKAATKTAATKKAGKKTVEAKATSEKAAAKKTVAAKAPAKKSPREIREWAIGAGHEVSSRGRISVEIERAFHDAQAAMPVA
ncbi:Lsr2 protein [Rhodococcus jostii]|uniref:Lsr2 protein n=2 Tax=Rhodococcus jostii TaxID=132919 RepID=A0A1H4IP12_RHOJO|nr:Lsr2 protein [Rhodococcus jostii]